MTLAIYIYTLEFQCTFLCSQMFVLKNEHSTKVPTTKGVNFHSHLSLITFSLKHIFLKLLFPFLFSLYFSAWNLSFRRILKIKIRKKNEKIIRGYLFLLIKKIIITF